MNLPACSTPLSRRAFLRRSALAASAVAFPAVLRGQDAAAGTSDRLNVAVIGVGGRGRALVEGLRAEHFVAFCDVDDARAARTFEEFPEVPRFRDFRRMFDRLGHRIDAVAIGTPDHTHFPAAMRAVAEGKHLLVEKPLTHTIWEARQLTTAARARGVVTQMGNQGHANEGTRLLREWVQAGVLGEVREVHSWTDRPIWPQGMSPPQPEEGATPPEPPASLDWDLWLGPAAARPFQPDLVPFRWRGWWDFGTGALGDMGCHIMDATWWALDLGAPAAVSAITTPVSAEIAPRASIVTYEFPARGTLPPVVWKWYDGNLQPPLPDDWEEGRRLPSNGTLLVGSRATVLTDTYNSSVRIVPETRMQELAPSLPPRTLPRVRGGPFVEWTDAIRAGRQPGSSFDYSGPLTETVLLGNLALRAGRRLEWDGTALRVTNHEPANAFVTKTYRPGWL
jgi:predicted dehydrogenase